MLCNITCLWNYIVTRLHASFLFLVLDGLGIVVFTVVRFPWCWLIVRVSISALPLPQWRSTISVPISVLWRRHLVTKWLFTASLLYRFYHVHLFSFLSPPPPNVAIAFGLGLSLFLFLGSLKWIVYWLMLCFRLLVTIVCLFASFFFGWIFFRISYFLFSIVSFQYTHCWRLPTNKSVRHCVKLFFGFLLCSLTCASMLISRNSQLLLRHLHTHVIVLIVDVTGIKKIL